MTFRLSSGAFLPRTLIKNILLFGLFLLLSILSALERPYYKILRQKYFLWAKIAKTESNANLLLLCDGHVRVLEISRKRR
mgnify:FL=1